MIATQPHSLLDPDREPCVIPMLDGERQAVLRSGIMTGWEYFTTCGFTLQGDEALPVDGSKTPYLEELFNTAMQPHRVYSRIALFCTPQVGKTTFMTNVSRGRTLLLGGNCLLGFPDEDFARKFMKREYLPRLVADPIASTQLPQEGTQAYRTRVTHTDIKLRRGTILARSLTTAVNTKSISCSTICVDELEEVPLDVGGQGDPLDLLEKRKVWHDASHSLSIYTGTFGAAGGHTEIVWNRFAHARLMLPCPACGGHGIIDVAEDPFHGGQPVFAIVTDKNATAEDLDRETGDALVHVECPHCRCSIAPRQVPGMVARGRYVCTRTQPETSIEVGETIDAAGVIHSTDPEGNPIAFAPGVDPTPRTSEFRSMDTAFWLNAACSPVVPLREFAAQWLRVRHSDDEMQRQEFWNNWRGMPLRTTVRDKDPRMLANRIDPNLPPCVLPSDTRRITMGCDVQKNGLWWVRMAWGPLLRPHMLDFGWIDEHEMWTLEDGVFVPGCVRELFALSDQWLSSSDGSIELQTQLGLIDCGEGMRNDEVIAWTLRHQSGAWKPCKGVDTGERTVSARVIDARPSGSSVLKKTKRFNVHRGFTSDYLHNVLTKPLHSPEAFSFHAQMTIDPETGEEIRYEMPVGFDELFKHLCSEAKIERVHVKRGTSKTKVTRAMWEKKSGHRRNDLLAALRYAYGGACVLRDEDPSLFEPGESQVASSRGDTVAQDKDMPEPSSRSTIQEPRVEASPEQSQHSPGQPPPERTAPGGFVMPQFPPRFGAM